MNKYLHLSLLSVLGLSFGASHGEAIKDSGKTAIVYITNSSKEPIRMIPYNQPNGSRYIHFNCLYPIPKKYQSGIPSPNFNTIVHGKYSFQSSVIKRGETVVYAFNSQCDNQEDPLLNETFGFVSKNKFSRTLLVYGNMYEDSAIRALDYTKRLSPSKAIYGNVVASHVGYAPFHITILPHSNLDTITDAVKAILKASAYYHDINNCVQNEYTHKNNALSMLSKVMGNNNYVEEVCSAMPNKDSCLKGVFSLKSELLGLYNIINYKTDRKDICVMSPETTNQVSYILKQFVNR